MLVAVALATATALSGCGSHPPQPAGLRVERTDLVLLARALQPLEHPIAREVRAARAAWPALSRGLPPTYNATTGLGVAIATAAGGATALALPSLVTVEGGLTGPAAAIGGLLKNYTLLTQRGWQFLVATRGASASSFLRANSGLYVYSVYDGHFELSVLGKKLQSAYAKLGGRTVFGARLTPGEIEALARAYSPAGVRLEPHPTPAVQV